jgi:hypothetical protein
MGWEKKHAESYGKDVKQRLRKTSVLELTATDIIEGNVATQVLSILTSQIHASIKVEDIQQLWNDARRGAGLED